MEWFVEFDGVVDTGGHEVGADAFVCSAGGDVGALRVAEHDADLGARLGSFGDGLEDAGVLGEEQAAVDQDVDLVAG
ncbi:hypothetical protein Ssi03_76790 [Sphaerisporangium siamense]|nr:hypothetical protein Ssi03_76790 [Sphaerisporangium siamense]